MYIFDQEPINCPRSGPSGITFSLGEAVVACVAYVAAGVLVWPLGGACLWAMDEFEEAVESYLEVSNRLRDECPSWFTEPIFCWRDGWYHLCP